MKKLSYLLFALITLCFGCRKDKPGRPISSSASGFNIQVLKGNSQKDTVGNLLKDSVKIKVSNSGSVQLSNYIVQFKRSNCQDITVTEQTLPATGLASFGWYLSGQAGGQSLEIILLDNNHKRIDSTSISATGIVGGAGWHRGGCVQNFEINGVSTLSSGRLLSSVNAVDYPYYSDDNAVSWLPLKSFSNGHFIDKIISGGSNQVFIATDDEGLFYSKDNGQTWANISGGIEDPTGFADFAYTPSGKLIYSDNSGVYISSDMGATWADASSGLPFGQSVNPCEELNGDLYIIGSDGELYKSTNEGSIWTNLGSSKGNILLASVESLFIDANGYMYLSNPHNGPGTQGGIFRSTDQGKTWANLFLKGEVGSSYPNITDISKMNGSYYFSFAGRGVYRTANFTNYSNLANQFAGDGLLSYTVAKNSNFVIGSPGFGIFYYVP